MQRQLYLYEVEEVGQVQIDLVGAREWFERRTFSYLFNLVLCLNVCWQQMFCFLEMCHSCNDLSPHMMFIHSSH